MRISRAHRLWCKQRVFWISSGVVLLAACASGAGGGPSTDECSEACAKIAAADCGDVGPECVDTCVRSAQPSAEQACPTELSAYVGCFWSAARYTCEAPRGTTAPDCADELTKYEACRSGGEGGAGGAGGDGGAATESAPAGVGGA